MARYRKKSNVFVYVLVILLCVSLGAGLLTHISRLSEPKSSIRLVLDGETLDPGSGDLYLKPGKTFNFEVLTSTGYDLPYTVKVVSNPKLTKTYTYSFCGDIVQRFDKVTDYSQGFGYVNTDEGFSLTLPYGCETALDVLQHMYGFMLDENSAYTTVSDDPTDVTSYYTLIVEYGDSRYKIDLNIFRDVKDVTLDMEGVVL